MWSRLAVVLDLVLVSWVQAAVPPGEPAEEHVKPSDALVAQLRTNANLDLSRDEEYEDLRAELLAYHSALNTLSSAKSSRRSMMTTPCWQLGGVCINFKLCNGHRFLTQVPGCKNRLNVCCFTWNQFQPRDLSVHGIGGGHYPWHVQYPYGGEGIITDSEPPLIKPKKLKHKKNKLMQKLNGTRLGSETLALILKTS